jgi:hypothetical protein
MEKTDDIDAPATGKVTTTVSDSPKDHDVSSKSSNAANGGAPETDYSSKAKNKTSFTDYLVTSPPSISN